MRRLVVMLVLVAACGGDAASLRVVAASSLTDALTEMATAFEAAHPEVSIEVSFAGSATIREQVLEGIPADVVITASMETMDVLARQEAVTSPIDVIATNEVVIGIPSPNEAGVRSLADLADEELLVGVCAEQVPCGALAVEAFEDASIVPAVDTSEPNVRQLLLKLVAGELDAGIVYRTDVAAAGPAVTAVPIPGAPTTSYPIAVTTDAADAETAAAFVRFATSSAGSAILAAHGFGPAP